MTAQLLPQAAGARARTSPVTAEDAKFMQMAIDQAKEADYPFGAVIVRGGRVLAFGRNSTKRNSDPTAHAEMMAIRAFLNGHEPDDLKDATLYSSGEPCVMCMGAIIWCGIKRLVFAASIAQLSTTHRADRYHREANRQCGVRSRSVEITGGLLSRRSHRPFSRPRSNSDHLAEGPFRAS